MLTHIILSEKTPFLSIIGGSMSYEKLIAINSLTNYCNEIWVVGEIGIYFIMYSSNFSTLLGYTLSNTLKEAIM